MAVTPGTPVPTSGQSIARVGAPVVTNSQSYAVIGTPVPTAGQTFLIAAAPVVTGAQYAPAVGAPVATVSPVNYPPGQPVATSAQGAPAIASPVTTISQSAYPSGAAVATTGQSLPAAASPVVATAQIAFPIGQPAATSAQTEQVIAGPVVTASQTLYPSGAAVATAAAIESALASPIVTTAQVNSPPGAPISMSGQSEIALGTPVVSVSQTPYPSGEPVATTGQAEQVIAGPVATVGQTTFPSGGAVATTGQVEPVLAAPVATVAQTSYPSGGPVSTAGQAESALGSPVATVAQTPFPPGSSVATAVQTPFPSGAAVATSGQTNDVIIGGPPSPGFGASPVATCGQAVLWRPTPVATCGQMDPVGLIGTNLELDVRLYDKNGLRIRLPMDWIVSVEFELLERGGCGTGTVKVFVPWDQRPGGLTLVGNERVDIRLFGQDPVLYRGWVRMPEAGIETPESLTLNLYGLMETLSHYRCLTDIVLPSALSVKQAFLGVLYNWVTVPGRLPSLLINTTGIDALGVLCQVLKCSGKPAREAFDGLCDLSPGLLIWTCDVDPVTGEDRINFLPRASSVGYKFSVGGKDVGAYIHPTNARELVNRLYVTGAKADRQLTFTPNMCPNASFEKQAVPGATTSNLLSNGSFETEGIDQYHFAPWVNNSGTSSIGNAGTSDPVFDGSNCLSLATDGISQTIGTTPTATYNAQAWFCEQIGSGYTATVRLGIDLLDVSNVVLHTLNGPWVTLTADNIYRLQTLSWNGPPIDPATAKARLRVECQSWSGQQPLVDTVSLWNQIPVQQDWQVGSSVGSTFATLDWVNHGIDAVDGFLVVKAQTSGSGGGNYGELQTRPDSRIQTSSGSSYWFSGYVRNDGGSAGSVQIGARCWKSDGTLAATRLSPVFTIPHGAGFVYLNPPFSIYTTADTTGVDLFIRFLDDNLYYVDAVGLWETPPPDAQPNGLYFPADTITAVRDTDAYVTRGVVSGDPQALSSGAGASISTYGVREGEASSDLVIDLTTLDAFCIGYFNAHAVPTVQARLTLESPDGPLGFDGMVKLINLPGAPDPLPVSKVRYIVGDSIRIEADLNSEREDLALLYKASAREGKTTLSAG